MTRYFLLRGVSAGALTFAMLSPALATHNLPTIDVGGQRRAAHHGTTSHAAGPVVAQPAAPAPGPAVVTSPAPSPVVSRWSPTLPDGKPAFVEKWQLPNTVASITRQQIERKINILDSEDAVRYMPSLFVRKRNVGDTQAVLQTRTWGIGSSARSLVYADDLLLTALIANDNNVGAPRWGLVAPEEIERVDMLYGPFSAQYPGNSVGGVLKITTRMPEKLEVSVKDTVAIQDFHLWGTNKSLVNNVTSMFVGNRYGDFSYTISGNWQRGSQQPLTYTTTPVVVPGSYIMSNLYGTTYANVLGSGGNLNNDQVNAKLKLAYDFTNTIRGTYTFGFWSNDGTSYPENYLVQGGGAYWGGLVPVVNRGRVSYNPYLTTAALQNFGAAYYRVQERIMVNAAAVKSNSGGPFDFEVSASNFTYLDSDQVAPWSAAVPYGGFTLNGRDSVFKGTYWTLFDAKGIARPAEGPLVNHDISFGVHGDQYHLNNPVWVTSNWAAGMAANTGVATSIAQGTTRTQALWAQDAIKLRDDLKFTAGIRGEVWQASNGYNQSANLNTLGTGLTGAPSTWLPIYQPNQYSTRFSPKGALEYFYDKNWTARASIGMANRFPTVSELYNLATVSSSGTVTNPNPNLRPENAISSELAIERKIGGNGTARVSFFDEQMRDAMIRQVTLIPATALSTTAWTNVQRIRNSGIEVAIQREDVGFKGLEVQASATWLNSRIIANPTWIPSAANAEVPWATSVAGKNVPNVPNWRGTLALTYRPDDRWAFTLAGRYQSKLWRTMANNDVAYGIYQAFDPFFVVDTKINYKWNDRFSFDFGIDNIGNYRYMLFHPFPQRTFFFAAKYEYGRDKKGAPGIFVTGDEGGLPDVSTWFQPVAFNWN
ncbi:TonB-dependent receptor [Methylocystis echinoides]|uniref:TonB-dependent receptor n=1 Tax=Methylocystis echinoides TaxID=29468 RepID=A0A9W6GRM8_9HYPH|nr:TonB-dependent receptor [Methylocystis echinoides]GLI91766.1 TonB-dependent receptor [Methylocystis echinoides]